MWTKWKVYLIVAGIAALLGALVGLGFGWKFWRSTPGKREGSAAVVVLPSGDVMLGRDAGGSPKPATAVPPGAKVERIIRVVVKPSPGPSTGETAPTNGSGPGTDATPGPPSTATNPCPPVQVDLTLVRMPDKTRRVIASSHDGQVLPGSSVDIPVDVADEPKVLKHAAGLVYGVNSAGGKSEGVFYDHDFKFLRTGAEVTRDTYSNIATGWSVRGKFGICW